MGKKKRIVSSKARRAALSHVAPPRRQTGFTSPVIEILLLSFLALLVFILYSNTFEAPFVLDDMQNIARNTHIRITELSIEGMKEAGFESPSSNRPLPNMSFALNYYLHRYNLTGYHLVNILIHIINGILLYFLIKTTLSIPSLHSVYGRYKWIPFFTALIWVAHPVQTQSVTYVVQRMNSMAVMFYLLSLLLYARARLTGEKGKRYGMFAGCIFAAVLALGSKEIAATLPLFIFLYEWYFFRELSLAWLKRKIPQILLILIVLALIGAIFLPTDAGQRKLLLYDYKNFTITERVLTEFRVVFYYISLLIFPHPSRLNLDYDFPLSHSLVDPITTLLSMLGIALLIGFAIYVAKKERLLSFCIVWFLGNLAIESSVVGLEILFEHRLYLPSISVSLIATILAYRYIKPDWLMVGVMGFLMILFSYWTYERNDIWKDDVTLWEDCVAKSPNRARPHVNLGFALDRNGRFEEALGQYSAALQIDPNDANTHYNIGVALVGLKRSDEAIPHYYEALRIDPDYGAAHHNLGVALEKQGNLEEAIGHYSRALSINPESAEAHQNLGIALGKQGKLNEAITHYLEALRIKPNYAEAHNSLGVAFKKVGKLNEAMHHYSEALRIRPDYSKAHNNIGAALEKQGKLDEALSHYSEALRIEPDNAISHYNLGGALVRLDRLDEAIRHFYGALKINPHYAKAHYNLGVALLRQGERKDAAFHFSEVLRINPGDPRARRALELLSR